MTRRQQIIIILLFFLLSSAVLATAISGNVLGQATIPTRTPTPDPEDPTDPPPEPTDDDGDDNTPRPTDAPPTNPPPVDSSSTPSSNATNTPIPSSSTPVATGTAAPVGGTATASPAGSAVTTTSEPAAVIGTPLGGVLAPGTTPVSFPVVATAFPTAQICGEPPTFSTLITALVYAGPGTEYEFVETLAADETRPIVGRAIYTSWWLIQLDGQFTQAWINDRTGIVDGYTANVPEVPAPAIDGATPTPGVRWDPTPVYDCDLTPTSTATGAPDSAGGGTTIEDDQESNLAAQLDSEEDQRSIIAATAAPLDIPSTASTPSLLPIAGLVLIIAAVFVALFLRRNPGGGEPTP